MALINCKECRGKTSLEADSCPHCGCKNPVPAKCIACGGWIFDESKPCPTCGDPNLPQAQEATETSVTPAKSGSTVKCRKCGKAVSPNAKDCPHCNCTEPAPVECQACGSDVDHEKDSCPECGHPLDCSKGKGKLIKCRKCDNKTSTEAPSCPKCNCTELVIEPLPFVKCRENDCGSIIHKEAKHCPNCGCPDPAPRDASTPKSGDFANACFLFKRKGTVSGPFKTNEVIKKIKTLEILPQQEMTIDGPVEFQVWRPAYHYLPFSHYENSPGWKNLKRKLKFAFGPALVFPCFTLAFSLYYSVFYRDEARLLEIYPSAFKLVFAVIAICFALIVIWIRSKEGAYWLMALHFASLFSLSFSSDGGGDPFRGFVFIQVWIIIVGLLYSIRLMERLEKIQCSKEDENDDKEAVKQYRKAAEQNDPDAQFNLGYMYEEGLRVEKDHREAIKWYRKAAEQNHADAQFNLGVMYEEGLGVDKDDKEAAKWYCKAADQGDDDAKTALKEISERQKPER